MSYAKAGHTKVHDLPDLEEIEDRSQQVQKFINNRHIPSDDSGMNRQPQFDPRMNGPPMAPPPPVQRLFNGPTCLEICYHIEQCPICSKFYKNDKSIYIITIVIERFKY